MNVIPLLQSVRKIDEWKQLPFFTNGQFTTVCAHLADEGRPVLPAAGSILRPFELTRRKDVRVVIVGQDPYPQYNRRLAIGLAFAVPVGTSTPQLPSSLKSIFKKFPQGYQTSPDLMHWATQEGVLLLNTTLTIPVDITSNPPEGVRNAHMRFGWSFLIRQVIESLVCRNDVFCIFFGVLPRDMDIIPPNLPCDQMIRIGHPARGGKPKDPWVSFGSSNPFTQANDFFQAPNLRRSPISW